MLNQHGNDEARRIGPVSDWCVGEPPVRWDVGLGARLAEMVRQLFWRDRGERALTMEPLPKVAEGPREMRKAA
jgi:hypothetical protein